MNTQSDFPPFDTEFQELNQFILTLVKEYDSGKVKSWDDLDKNVKSFFTPERMDDFETKAPGWKKMASYSDGITLTHVTCVFLGLFMLPELKSLSETQQQLAKWIVLFHDIDKIHIRGVKDAMHAFRSGVVAADIMPKIGFPVTGQYDALIRSWSELTVNAFTLENGNSTPKPDNQKLPEILSGIEQLFGENTPATLIAKTVLLHISLSVDPFYPTPSPLTEDEIKRFINSDLFPLLRVMMLVDNEGWSLFNTEVRARQRKDTLKAFANIESLIKDRAI
ncbi:MAG: hypothetical protein HGA30_03205 [Anaerolineales bacterium]|nr:hypothetical protein [Anaerolineales bacterium]